MQKTHPIGFQDCKVAIPVDKKMIADLCGDWKISELYLFGSIIRDDFHMDSDVDVMVSFAPSADVGLFEFVEIQQRLENIFTRKIDLVTRRSVESSKNWIRRREILRSAKLLYAT